MGKKVILISLPGHKYYYIILYQNFLNCDHFRIATLLYKEIETSALAFLQRSSGENRKNSGSRLQIMIKLCDSGQVT